MATAWPYFATPARTCEHLRLACASWLSGRCKQVTVKSAVAVYSHYSAASMVDFSPASAGLSFASLRRNADTETNPAKARSEKGLPDVAVRSLSVAVRSAFGGGREAYPLPVRRRPRRDFSEACYAASWPTRSKKR